jgi:hypothetical protein
MTSHNRTYTYKRFLPAEPLAAFVKFFYYFHGAGEQSERILPQSLAEITFNVEVDGAKSFIIPSGHQPYFVVPDNLHRILGICFHPWGLHALFKLPPGQLSKTKIPLADALPDFTAISDRILYVSSRSLRLISDICTLRGYKASRLRRYTCQ